jgi:hypothetical protein
MAKKNFTPQNYPRLDETNALAGYLDDSKVKKHQKKISSNELSKIIQSAVEYANRKSSRAILAIPDGTSDEQAAKVYFTEGANLFNYFRVYCGDPAATAYQCKGRHYKAIAEEQFRNRTLQKERMNSGWRYQKIAIESARKTERFDDVSESNQQEADFTVKLGTINFDAVPFINIYVSVKNRSNTVGGQDMPKVIAALENAAREDKNRDFPYICVFGIAMERGNRVIRKPKKSNVPYSVNTEMWLSDYFWPFFSNCSYEEIMLAVCEYFQEQGLKKENKTIGITIPNELVESFGQCCKKYGLVDADGVFQDEKKLVKFFCSAAKA